MLLVSRLARLEFKFYKQRFYPKAELTRLRQKTN